MRYPIGRINMKIDNLADLIEFEKKNPYWRLCECCNEECDCGCVEFCPVHKQNGLQPAPFWKELEKESK